MYPKISASFLTYRNFLKLLINNGNRTRIQNSINTRLMNDEGPNKILVIFFLLEMQDSIYPRTKKYQLLSAGKQKLTVIFKSYRNGLRSCRNRFLQPPLILKTDLYLQADYVAHKLPTTLYTYNNQKFIDCKHLLPENHFKSIIQFHTMTGCDSNSLFCGHSRKKYDKLDEGGIKLNVVVP